MGIRITALALIATALPAQANTPIAEVLCSPRDEMIERLTVQYHARMTANGLRDVEAVMEIWTDPKGRWTLVQSYTNGQACIVAMGTDWDAVTLPPA